MTASQCSRGAHQLRLERAEWQAPGLRPLCCSPGRAAVFVASWPKPRIIAESGPRAGSSLNTTWARCGRLTEASARARSISLREAARFNPAQPVAVPCLERGLRRVANKVEVPGHGRGFSRVILPTAAVAWCKQRVETTRHESRIHLLLSRNGRALISSTESGPNKAGLACTIFTMTWDEIGAATREAVFVVTLGELDQTTIILDLAHMVYPACYGFAGELLAALNGSTRRCCPLPRPRRRQNRVSHKCRRRPLVLRLH